MFFREGKVERYLKDLKANLNLAEKEINYFKKYPANLKNKSLIDFSKAEGRDFQVGESWGGRDQSVWFKSEFKLPADWGKENELIYLDIRPGI